MPTSINQLQAHVSQCDLKDLITSMSWACDHVFCLKKGSHQQCKCTMEQEDFFDIYKNKNLKTTSHMVAIIS